MLHLEILPLSLPRQRPARNERRLAKSVTLISGTLEVMVMDADTLIISLEHVHKEFEDGFVAVDDFHLGIKRGEFVTLLGPSGCGKTTTLRMIAGFSLPSSGKILLNGEDITNLPPYKRPVNTVFQHYALFPNLDVYENVAFGLKNKRIPYEGKDWRGRPKTKYKRLSPEVIDEKVAKALKIVDLEDMEDRDVASLSGGQQQRVAIARAIVNEPQVLLLDEPLSALDRKMRKDMQLELKEMHRKLGITFIYVTHDQEEALSMSDTIVVMKDGAIMQVGSPEKIYNEPVNAYVADFIGESNIYNATMVGDKKVRFLGGVFPCVDDFPLNEKVDVVVRPEDVLIFEPGKGIIDAKVSSKVFKGEMYQYVLLVGKAEVLCRSTESYEIGEKVSISVLAKNIQVMHKELTENEYMNAWLDGKGNVIIGEEEEISFPADYTALLNGSHIDADGYLVDAKTNKKYDLKDADIRLTIPLDKVELEDDLSKGECRGVIISSVWVGDHYQYMVRTEGEEDFVADTPYAWNIGDEVAIHVAKENLHLSLRKELSTYAVEE